MNPCKDRSPRVSWIVVGLLLLCAPVTQAQQQPPAPTAGDGISVSGSGEAKAKPTAVEISATVSGDAELAADAIIKYRDTKRRAVEALEGLKLEGLKIESGGFAINQGVDEAQQQAMMQGNAVAGSAKQRVTVTEQIKVVLGGLDKLKDEELMDTVLKVVDTGRDGGLQIGAAQPQNYYQMQMYYNNGRGDSTLVAFVISDPEALREQACKAAMDDARKRAERLASLAGVKLGRILSIRDQGEAAMNPQMAQMYAMTGQMPDSGEDLSSGVFAEIPVRVNLAVQFEIAAGGEPRVDASDRSGRTDYNVRFEPKDPSQVGKQIDVRLSFQGDTIQVGPLSATVSWNDGVVEKKQMQVQQVANGLLLQPWPLAQDTGYSILFTPPKDRDAVRWPSGSLVVTSDVGDEDAGAVAVSKL